MTAQAMIHTASNISNNKGINQHTTILYVLFLLPVIFLFFETSMFLLEEYHSGDQLVYKSFYNRLKGLHFSDISQIQRLTIGGVEPLYGLVMWIGANIGIDKNTYISIFNVILCLLIILLLAKFRTPFHVIALVVTNYYFLFLLTSAERLKFSYIILLLMTLFSGRTSLALSAIAPLFHFQSIINYVSLFCAKISVRHIKVNRKIVIRTAIVIIISGIYILKNYLHFILYKISIYFSQIDLGSMVSLINLSLLIALSCVISDNKKRMLAMSAPIIISVLLLGPERTNMIGVTMVYYFLSQERKLGHWMMYPVHLYFSFKSIGYIERVVLYGDGFYPV